MAYPPCGAAVSLSTGCTKDSSSPPYAAAFSVTVHVQGIGPGRAVSCVGLEVPLVNGPGVLCLHATLLPRTCDCHYRHYGGSMTTSLCVLYGDSLALDGRGRTSVPRLCCRHMLLCSHRVTCLHGSCITPYGPARRGKGRIMLDLNIYTLRQQYRFTGSAHCIHRRLYIAQFEYPQSNDRHNNGAGHFMK